MVAIGYLYLPLHRHRYRRLTKIACYHLLKNIPVVLPTIPMEVAKIFKMPSMGTLGRHELVNMVLLLYSSP